jgi:hypothetical protein
MMKRERTECMKRDGGAVFLKGCVDGGKQLLFPCGGGRLYAIACREQM